MNELHDLSLNCTLPESDLLLSTIISSNFWYSLKFVISRTYGNLDWIFPNSAWLNSFIIWKTWTEIEWKVQLIYCSDLTYVVKSFIASPWELKSTSNISNGTWTTFPNLAIFPITKSSLHFAARHVAHLFFMLYFLAMIWHKKRIMYPFATYIFI